MGPVGKLCVRDMSAMYQELLDYLQNFEDHVNEFTEGKCLLSFGRRSDVGEPGEVRKKLLQS